MRFLQRCHPGDQFVPELLRSCPEGFDVQCADLLRQFERVGNAILEEFAEVRSHVSNHSISEAHSPLAERECIGQNLRQVRDGEAGDEVQNDADDSQCNDQQCAEQEGEHIPEDPEHNDEEQELQQQQNCFAGIEAVRIGDLLVLGLVFGGGGHGGRSCGGDGLGVLGHILLGESVLEPGDEAHDECPQGGVVGSEILPEVVVGFHYISSLEIYVVMAG